MLYVRIRIKDRKLSEAKDQGYGYQYRASGQAPEFRSMVGKSSVATTAGFEVVFLNLKHAVWRVHDLSPFIPSQFSKSLQSESHNSNFDIHSALEKIVYQAKALGNIKILVRIEPEIDKIPKLERFKAVLNGEVEASRLVYEDVETCVCHVYHEVSKHTHGNNSTIII
ncbi:hypothetical protein HOY80DRAFT_1037253 [Tuber brumale]|nr:hypothetical protein HOY80DRAFT_1037253 [Tuber brumale]